jgi:excisionase family DNA binding protein
MQNQAITEARTLRASIEFESSAELLDDKAAAALLDVSPGTLSVWRSTGRYALPFLKIGRKVRYRRSALEAWMQARTRESGATA